MKIDRISGAFWLFFALLAVKQSYILGLGSFEKPGSGLFPFVAACLLGILSIFVILQAQFGKRMIEGRRPNQLQAWPKVVLLLTILFAYTFMLEKIGFVLATFFLVFILLKTVEPQPWSKSIIFAVLVTIIFYIIFVVWLKVQMPVGLLGMMGF